MNLPWLLSDKGTRVRFYWIPSHCGIERNERVVQLAKGTLDQDTGVYYTDVRPLVNSYTQQLDHTKSHVAVHDRDLYLVKPTLGPRKKCQHIARAQGMVNTRFWSGHTITTKSLILCRRPPTTCHHCCQILTNDHTLLKCAVLQECRDEYYTADSLNTPFETITDIGIV